MLSTIVLILLGLIVVLLGVQHWRKEKESSVQSSNYDGEKKEEKKKFALVSGHGVMLMGIGMLLSGIFLAITEAKLSFVFMGAGFILGFAILIYGGQDY